MITPFELLHSETAVKRDLFNAPTNRMEWENLLSLMSVLATVRSKVDFPIVVTSGFRSPAVNRAVGGAKNSAHLHGLAVDVKLKSELEYKKVTILFKTFAIKLGYGYHVINEKPVNGVPSWLHLELKINPKIHLQTTIK